jgi:acetolactate synthase I/II/III large subunit
VRAADAIVESLKAHGVERVYCVPGESYLALLDAFHDSGIDVIVCRHEGGAGFMAAAEAKLTAKPSVVLVSRGPGATNASIALHMAEQDALPVLLMIGQVSRHELTRGVFQEMDYSQFFGGIAKGVFEIHDGKRVHDILPRAFRLACEGTPGPVVLSLPEDMLNDPVEPLPPVVFPPTVHTHGSKELARIQDMLARSERPIVVAGAALRGPHGAEALHRFAQAQRIPVATTWKNQDVFDNTSALYAGHLGFGAPQGYKNLLADADLIFAVGTRLGDVASLGFTFPRAPDPEQILIHVYPDGKPLGKNIRTDFGLVANPAQVLADLSQQARVVSSAREAWISKVHGFTQHHSTFQSINPEDGVDFGSVVVALEKYATRDAVITTDAGNMSTWVHRHWKMTTKNSLIGGIAGAMGLGVPAAIAASLVAPLRQVICFVGDGGVLMTGQELATAVAYGVAPKIVISDNGIYGTIRTHQEREYPGRVSGTNLNNPDFKLWAESFGATAFQLSLGDNIENTVAVFLAAEKIAVLHVKSSKQALSAFGTLPSA